MQSNLGAQLIGFIAVAINIWTFQVNDRRKMLNIGALAACIYTVHFYLLGAYTGSAMNAVGGARDLITARVAPSRNNIWLLFLLIAIAALGTYFTWHGIISLLPLLGTTLNAISFWNKNPKTIRRLYLAAPPVWFIYNIIVHSFPGMLIEIVMLLSNLIGQYRFDWRKNSSPT